MSKMDELQRQRVLKKTERDCEEIFRQFGRKVAESQKDINPEIQQIVDEHFWEML